MLRRNRYANVCMAVSVLIHSLNTSVDDLRKLLILPLLM